MRFRGSSRVLLLGAFILLAGLLAGCGGGEGQPGNNESQNGGAPGGKKEQGGAAQGDALQAKIALGTITSVRPDHRRIILRPSTEIQGGKRMVFKIIDKAEITLNDKPAEMTDVKEGQQAQIQYVVVNDVNRARVVALISDGEGTGG